MPVPTLPAAGSLEDLGRWRTWLFESMTDYAGRSLTDSAETCRFQIAGASLRFRFANAGLRQVLTRALAHLAAPDDGAPDLDVTFWDSESAGGPPFLLLRAYLSAVACEWWEFLNARGELKEFHGPPLLGAYHPGTEVLSLLNLDENRALYFKRNPRSMPYYEAGSPMRTMLHWWFRARGRQFVHAAAVGVASGGVLLAGKGGSGKSTSALSCLGSGLLYASDDYCMVGLEPRPEVFSLYNTCKLVGDADLARFPGLADRVWNRQRTGEDKATIFLHEQWPELVTTGFPLKAILVPRVTGLRDTRLAPCRGMDALVAVAPSTMAQLPSSDGQDLARLKRLVQSLPAYTLEVGTDLKQIPATILELLARLGS
jgi:hypothetical protein